MLRPLVYAAAAVAAAAAAQTPPASGDLLLWGGPRPGVGLLLEDVPLGDSGDPSASALHFAAASISDPETILALIMVGADPAAVDSLGRTPLHVAAERNPSAAVVGALVGAGAPVNAVDASGRSALHLASSPQATVALLRGGADPCLEDATGLSALSAERAQATVTVSEEAYEETMAALFRCLSDK
jgi:hypothetical protein